MGGKGWKGKKESRKGDLKKAREGRISRQGEEKGKEREEKEAWNREGKGYDMKGEKKGR